MAQPEIGPDYNIIKKRPPIEITEYIIKIDPGTHMWCMGQKWPFFESRAIKASFNCPVKVMEHNNNTVQVGMLQGYETSPDRLQLTGLIDVKDNFDFYKMVGKQQKEWKKYVNKR